MRQDTDGYHSGEGMTGETTDEDGEEPQAAFLEPGLDVGGIGPETLRLRGRKERDPDVALDTRNASHTGAHIIRSGTPRTEALPAQNGRPPPPLLARIKTITVTRKAMCYLTHPPDSLPHLISTLRR